MKISSIDLLGVRVDLLNTDYFIKIVEELLSRNDHRSEYVVTPYSEFFYLAQQDADFKDALDKAVLSIPDGIFCIWASKFLSMPYRLPKFLRFFETLFQFFISGVSLIFWPSFARAIIRERVSGSEVVYNLAYMAAAKGYKIAILGGFDFGTGNTGTIAANKLRERYPALQIVEVYPGDRTVEETGEPVINALKASGADILFCCYAPVRQEKWLRDNLAKTGIKVGIALGGTIDYVAGVKKQAPPIFRKLGLEWFIRPFIGEMKSSKTFTARIKRGWMPAMIKSSLLAFRFKLNGGTLRFVDSNV